MQPDVLGKLEKKSVVLRVCAELPSYLHPQWMPSCPGICRSEHENPNGPACTGESLARTSRAQATRRGWSRSAASRAAPAGLMRLPYRSSDSDRSALASTSPTRAAALAGGSHDGCTHFETWGVSEFLPGGGGSDLIYKTEKILKHRVFTYFFPSIIRPINQRNKLLPGARPEK